MMVSPRVPGMNLVEFPDPEEKEILLVSVHDDDLADMPEKD
jgi:hypothetical protein